MEEVMIVGPRITITIPECLTEDDISRAMMVYAAMRQEFVDVMTGRDREKDAAFARTNLVHELVIGEEDNVA